MKTLLITTTSVIIIGAVALSVFPGLRGPFNRFRNDTNEALYSEYVVDNYKAKYIELNDRKTEINGKLTSFRVEQKVAENKLSLAKAKSEKAKEKLLADGSNDLKVFEANKLMFESTKSEIQTQESLINTYSNAIVKLTKSLDMVEAEMTNKRQKIEEIESKKQVLDAMKATNKTVESLNSLGEDVGIDFGVEKLEDDTLRESIKMEALSQVVGSESYSAETSESAKAYIDSLK